MAVSLNTFHSSNFTPPRAVAIVDTTVNKTEVIARRIIGGTCVVGGAITGSLAYVGAVSFTAAVAGIGLLFFGASLLLLESVTSSISNHPQAIQQLANENGFVAFYDKRDRKTDFLGNFHLRNFSLGRFTFQCAEAAFQAGKDPTRMAEFVGKDGDRAFRHGKAVTPTADWISGGRNIAHMRQVLRAKFQNPQLRELLLATENAYLLEHCPKGRDKFWADNGDGSGKNMLGKLLMELRGSLGGTGIVLKPPQDAYTKLAKSPLA